MNFIRREKIYILMLIFIVAVNVMNGRHAEKEKAEEKKALSTMTFEEAGVTEEKVRDFLKSEKPSAIFFRYSIVLGFFIFIASVISNIVFIFRKEKINFKTLPYRKAVSWGVSDLVKAGIIIIFTGYVIGIIESVIFKVFHLEIGLNLKMMLDTFFIDIAVAAVIFYFIKIKYREGLRALGLRLESVFSNILSGIGAYILMLPLLLGILILSVWFLNLLGYTPPPQPVFEVFMEEERNRVLFFLTIFVSLVGPMVEELFFRGFMFSAVKKHFGFLGAAFLSASIFSILHTNIAGFLPIMALGVLLAYLYEKTGSLVAPMAVHILHNSIIVGFVFFIKQLIP